MDLGLLVPLRDVFFVEVMETNGGQMKSLVHWIVSIIAAGWIAVFLNKLLPLDMSRVWIIAISGLAGIFWCYFVDWPLKTWANKPRSDT